MLSGRLGIIGFGGVVMLVSMILRKEQFPRVAIWKMVVVALLTLITGVFGTMVLAYIEMGEFGGTSFYGAVFLVPVLMFPALLLKMNYKDVLNLVAPAECAMLFVMRFDCLSNGCCFGRYIPQLEFQFPSQISEMVVAVAIMFVLIWMHVKNKQVQLYPWYMILYGACRFILQGFRYGGTEPWVLGLSQGHFWSLISIIIGTAWLLLSRRRKATVKKS